MKEVKGSPAKAKPARPYMFDCHLLPQASWVHGWNPDKNVVVGDQRSCTHVLRFDRLTQDFNDLMIARGYRYRLTSAKMMASEGPCAALRGRDLSQETREL